jgi:hypothetical protein
MLAPILTGTNTELVMDLLLLPWLLVLATEKPAELVRPNRILKFLFVIGLIAAIFLPYFGLNMLTRSTTGAVGAASTGTGVIYPKMIEIPGLRGSLAYTYMSGTTMMASYVGQGYYGLSLCLQEPFAWTYGVGHSRFYIWLAEKALGETQGEILDRTYPYRIDHDFGWSGDTSWSTSYSWFAGDVTFFGVPVLMFLLGRLLASTWLDSIGRNPVAVVVFSLTLLILFFTSASPAVFERGAIVNVFYIYLFLWFWSRRPVISRPVMHSALTRWAREDVSKAPVAN